MERRVLVVRVGPGAEVAIRILCEPIRARRIRVIMVVGRLILTVQVAVVVLVVQVFTERTNQRAAMVVRGVLVRSRERKKCMLVVAAEALILRELFVGVSVVRASEAMVAAAELAHRQAV